MDLSSGDEVSITVGNEIMNGKVSSVDGDNVTVTINITLHASKVTKKVEVSSGYAIDKPPEPTSADDKPPAPTAKVAETVAASLNIQVLTPRGDLVSKSVVNSTATVKELKTELVNICGVDESQQTLLHGQDILDDASRWMDTSIKEGDVATLSIESPRALTNTTIKEAVRDFCKGDGKRKEVERVYGQISRWNTAEVTDMSFLFYQNIKFNEDLTTWNVSKVTNMASMFNGASRFNADLSAWDVSCLRNMAWMFHGASRFNGTLSAWNVSNVTNMNWTFANAASFNGDLSAWDVANVQNMAAMFGGASRFNANLAAWDVSNVTDMYEMFLNAAAFSGDLSTWNVSRVTNMGSMFSNASAFNGDVSTWKPECYPHGVKIEYLR